MKTDSPNAETNANASAGSADLVVRLADRFDILADQRSDATDRPFHDCFRARRAGQPQDLMAVATGIAPLARSEVFSQMRSIERPGLQQFYDWGVVDWPGGERRLALIFARPSAPPTMKSLDEVRPPMGEDELVRMVLAPVRDALHEMHQRGIHHGAVRPTNVFYNPAGGPAMLGEGVSAPPSFLQPAICEPIERALAEPAGRGPGRPLDDLYSLGMLIAILALGQNPLRTLSVDQQIELKIDRGSYAAVIGNARIPSGLIEPLRGLLTDDLGQRWDTIDVAKWISGRRQTPRQSGSSRRAQRPLQFRDTEFWNPRSLATAMSRNVPEAVKLIDGGEIDRWVRRYLGDVACANRVADTVATTPPQGKGVGAFEERLVARTCIALDPTAPIRYGGRSVLPQGVGSALAYTMARGESVQPIAELINANLADLWYSARGDESSEAISVLKGFDKCRTILERTSFGYGIERTVYEMAPSLPCISDMIVRHYVNSPTDLLPALEAAAADVGRRPTTPLDRHLAGFLVARNRTIGEPLLNALAGTGAEGERHLALLNILAGIQRASGPASLPKLAHWFAASIATVAERYHSRKLRRQVQKELAIKAQSGDLTELQRLVDDPQVISRDQNGFRQAQAVYRALADEISRLNEFAVDRPRLEKTVGRETAAVVSSGVAVLATAGIVLILAMH